jgi:hypothetical protein
MEINGLALVIMIGSFAIIGMTCILIDIIWPKPEIKIVKVIQQPKPSSYYYTAEDNDVDTSLLLEQNTITDINFDMDNNPFIIDDDPLFS